MAGSIDSEEAALLDYIINTRTPLTKWVGLSTTTPTETGSNFTEPSGFNYSRASVTSSMWSAAVGGAPSVKLTSASVVFPVAGGSWGTIVAVGLFTASSGGSPFRWGLLDVSRAVALNQQPSFDAGQLRLKLGDPGDTY